MQNIFFSLSKALWWKIDSCYSILFSNPQQKWILLLVELSTVALVPCILRHPYTFVKFVCKHLSENISETESHTDVVFCMNIELTWLDFGLQHMLG